MSDGNASRRATEAQSAQKVEINAITGAVVDCAVKIHADLGPGLMESVYEAILHKKLEGRGLRVARQVAIPVRYEGLSFQEAFRADLIVEGQVILELKSIDQISKAHRKQLLTYLKLSGLQVGLLLNFGAHLMRDGIARVVCDYRDT